MERKGERKKTLKSEKLIRITCFLARLACFENFALNNLNFISEVDGLLDTIWVVVVAGMAGIISCGLSIIVSTGCCCFKMKRKYFSYFFSDSILSYLFFFSVFSKDFIKVTLRNFCHMILNSFKYLMY